jgi:NAD dependent epimerase/dehydratase family enzyme
MSWIALHDEVRALRFLGEQRGLSGAFNLTAPRPVTNIEFTEELRHAVASRAPLFVPRRLLELAAGKETADEMLLASQRALPAALQASDFSFEYPDLASALRVVTTSDGLRTTQATGLAGVTKQQR